MHNIDCRRGRYIFNPPTYQSSSLLRTSERASTRLTCSIVALLPTANPSLTTIILNNGWMGEVNARLAIAALIRSFGILLSTRLTNLIKTVAARMEIHFRWLRRQRWGQRLLKELRKGEGEKYWKHNRVVWLDLTVESSDSWMDG